MGFASYVLRRLAFLGLVLLGVSMVIFFVLRGMPGVDPLAAYITPGLPISQDALQVLRKELHLDEPCLSSTSTTSPTSSAATGVTPARRRNPSSARCSGVCRRPSSWRSARSCSASGLGVPAGILAALRKDRAPDVTVRVLSLTGISFPVFWVGIILQLVFFYYLGALGLPSLPSRGRVDEQIALQHQLSALTGLYLVDGLVKGNLPFLMSAMRHLILPAFTLSLISLAAIVRIMRASMLEVLRQDYILLARSKGVPPRLIIARHALRNAITPVLTTAGTTLGYPAGRRRGGGNRVLVARHRPSRRAGHPEQRQRAGRGLHALRRHDDGPGESRRRRPVRRRRSEGAVLTRLWQSKLATLGCAIFLSMFVIAATAPFFIRASVVREVKFGARLQPPDATNWFGTDDFGRDLFSMVLLAAHLDLRAALTVVLAALVIGTVLGAVAGLVRKLDEPLMRITDIFLSIPSLVLAMAIASVLGRSVGNLSIALIVVSWPIYCRLMRGQVLSEKEKPYVKALQTLGVGRARLIARHIIPNTMFPVIARAPDRRRA